jgi:PAS domain S-box-containing protein
MTPNRQMTRLHRLYYLLALFNVLTVAASLYVGHELIDIVKASTAVHRTTQVRLDRYSEIGRRAQVANGPVNDVFAGGAVDVHENAFLDAVASFTEALEAERRETGRLPLEDRQTLARHEDEAGNGMAAMARAASVVFQQMRAGDLAEASRAMVGADQAYGRISSALRQMRGDAVRLQAKLLDAQEAAATERRWNEITIAFAVLVMVAAAAVYGQQLSARLQRIETERLEHLAEVERAQLALREQAGALEERVALRTAELAGQRAQLVESQRHMAEAQQLANIGSWAWDVRSGFVVWSDQQHRVMGYEPGTVTPTYDLYLQAVHPDDREAADAEVRRAIQTGEPFVIRHKVVAADGGIRHVESRGKAVKDADGPVIGLTGTSQDITVAYTAEHARRAAEEQFRAYVENTAEWVWALDPRGYLTYSNHAVFDILGYEPEELIGKDVRPLVEPGARAATERLLPEVIAGRQRWDGIVRRFLHKNGEWRYLESSGMPVFDEQGRFTGFRGAERDITRRKLTEDALRRSEERFQLASRATNDVLWDLDVTSGFVWRNDGMRRLFGHAEGAQQLAAWTSLLHPDERDAVRGRLEAFLASERELWTDEYRLRRADGTYAWVLDRGIAVRVGGRPVRMIGSMADITERKEAERMKSDFVSFVSHQLRTPLAGMNWMLELAAEAEHLPAIAAGYIAEARESAARLSTLVNDLLDIARLESGRTMMAREAVRLDEITRSVLREMQTVVNEKGHTVKLEANGAGPAVGDQQMLRQVIANLLSNAIKYTPDGGRIEVQVTQRKDLIEWSVQDNGMGIPPAAQARLFEKFYRAENAISKEAEGTGLGLHLVRLVVEHAGGQIWCESEEGEGSRFTFTLPVAQQEGVNA